MHRELFWYPGSPRAWWPPVQPALSPQCHAPKVRGSESIDQLEAGWCLSCQRCCKASLLESRRLSFTPVMGCGQRNNSLLSCCEKQLWHCSGRGKATEGCSASGDGGVRGGEKRVVLLPGKGMRVVSDGKHFIRQVHCLLFRPSLSKSSQGMPVIFLFFSVL